MDWYAENILSVTGTYYGVEKTIEKEFDVFKKSKVRHHCFKISCYTINSVGSVSDGTNLNGVRGVETFTIGDSTYVVAAAQWADKIVIFDISDPTNPTSVGRVIDDSGTKKLNDPYDVAIATIGGSTYAVVTAYTDNGVQIIDISDPTSPSATAIFSDTGGNNRCLEDNDRCLRGPVDVEIATIGSYTYAVLAGNIEDGIKIIDISTPSSP